MKTLKMHFLLAVMFCCYSVSAQTNLDQIKDVNERNSLILKIAKEAVMKWGPDYYRDEIPPEITDMGVITTEDFENKRVYRVTYYYNTDKEILEEYFAAKVLIRADTGRASNIRFGNGCGFGIHNVPKEREKEIVPMSFSKLSDEVVTGLGRENLIRHHKQAEKEINAPQVYSAESKYARW